MVEQRELMLEQLRTASPWDTTNILLNLELYDKKSTLDVLNEIYKEFETGEHLKDEVVKPVFMSIIDGLLECTSFGRSARRKGLTASRVVQECENFRYEEELTISSIDGYTEYKNARHDEIEYRVDLREWELEGKKQLGPEYEGRMNTNTSEKYNREKYQNTAAMKAYKEDRLIGEKTLVDEYTGKRNLYLKNDNPHLNYKDETHRMQAQPDHIVPLKQIHEKFKTNYALDDSDIKQISNIDDNFAVTAAGINQVKKDMSNEEYIHWMEDHGTLIDQKTQNNMRNLQKSAERAVEKEANKTITNNLLGRNGAGTEKTIEIHKQTASKALEQSRDYAVGNVILFILKPLYYELTDILKNGLQDGVGACSGVEALKLRFGRIKTHVMSHAKEFLGNSILDFIKGFISSLIEGFISLFVGIFKQVLKIVKEGIKIFVSSAKVLWGKDSSNMTSAQKGDAIVKIIGGGVLAIAGVGIEFLLNKIGIGEPWSIVIATILSGIASALFMYLLDKVDLFGAKLEKRSARVAEVFQSRIQDIEDATNSMNSVAIETLRRQREEFEEINTNIQNGFKIDSIDIITENLYKMACWGHIDLGFTHETFLDHMDSSDPIKI